MTPKTLKTIRNIALAYFLLMCAAGIGVALAALYNYTTGHHHEIPTQRNAESLHLHGR